MQKIQGFSTVNSNDELFGKENGGGGRREFHRVSQGSLRSVGFNHVSPKISGMHTPPIPPKE